MAVILLSVTYFWISNSQSSVKYKQYIVYFLRNLINETFKSYIVWVMKIHLWAMSYSFIYMSYYWNKNVIIILPGIALLYFNDQINLGSEKTKIFIESQDKCYSYEWIKNEYVLPMNWCVQQVSHVHSKCFGVVTCKVFKSYVHDGYCL